MKKWIISLLSASLVLFAFSGCGGGSATDEVSSSVDTTKTVNTSLENVKGIDSLPPVPTIPAE